MFTLGPGELSFSNQLQPIVGDQTMHRIRFRKEDPDDLKDRSQVGS
jgi:hypothetical protein